MTRTFAVSLFALLSLAAAGCATTLPEHGVPASLLRADVPNVHLVSGETHAAYALTGWGSGLKHVALDVPDAPRAPLFVSERQLVVTPTAVISFDPLAGMVDDDTLFAGAFYAGRKVPEGAGEVVKTTPKTE